MLHVPQFIIRDATAGDVPRIAALGALFHVEAGWDDIASYNVKHCEASLSTMIERGEFVFIVAECEGEIIGIAAGALMPLYFNAAHIHGQEMFFWVDPAHRGRVGTAMLEALEGAGASAGAQSWAMVALSKVKPELTGRLYARRGYRPSEHYHIKRLD